MHANLVLLEAGAAFADPLTVIRADTPAMVPEALAAMAKAQADGHHLAGYFSYELGYALEPRLEPLMPPQRPAPLLWFGVYAAPLAVPPPSQGRAYAGPLCPQWDETAYGPPFAAIQDYIAAGDIYQANLSFPARFAFVGDPLTLYRALAARSAAAHCAYIDDGARHILSFSPELFFALSADGVLTARPMKGTAARGATARDDAAAGKALAASEKNRAENLMIVDLLRNDLGRIARIGSVSVTDLFAVETYPTLHTMVSTVTARLKPDTAIARIVQALFPCGSVTGAPKIRAMQIIREVESGPRGIYCGAIGHFAPDGAARFNVAIRTLTITGNEGVLGIGGAVVRDSRREDEYAECLLKARFFTDAHRALELIETLKFDGGFIRLERHLARLEHSARVFAMPFTRARAIAALEKAVAGKSGAHRVRLTLGMEGFSCIAVALAETKMPWRYTISPRRICSADRLQRHKTTWRELYESEAARLHESEGVDEVLFLNERGEVAEASRSNVFVKRAGKLLTPPLASGALPGCLRGELLDSGACAEAVLMPRDLEEGDVFFGNSLRGLIAAQR
jgi:para-aminobenzoate synthetase/4-amino-4-deoxychorismate lyase